MLLLVQGRVKLVEGDFLRMSASDDRWKDIKLVLVTANCTKSAVANPVNFLLSEGESMFIL